MVSLTMSCPHRLALKRWLAMFHKMVASHVDPAPITTDSSTKVARSDRAAMADRSDPVAPHISKAPSPAAIPSQLAQSVAFTSGCRLSHDELRIANTVQHTSEASA